MTYKNMVAVVWASLALLLVQTCLPVGGAKTYSEDELYQSKLWREDSSVLIITRGRDGRLHPPLDRLPVATGDTFFGFCTYWTSCCRFYSRPSPVFLGASH